MKSVAIIGAGITGLTAAFYLKRKGIPVVVYEAGERAGGVIQSVRKDGFLAEFGPNTLLETSPKISQLIRDAGLAARRLDTSPQAEVRYVVRGGKPVAMPSSQLGIFTSELLSAGAKLAILREPFVAARWDGAEESVAQFVVRRLNQEFLDRLVDALVAGIYAGDPYQLSVQHALPRLKALEDKYGSLIKGQFKGARERKKTGEVARDRAPKLSFDEGLQVLPDTLAAQLGDALKLNTPVTALTQIGGNWRVTTTKGEAEFGVVLYCGTAYKLAELKIETGTPLNLSTFTEIRYPPVASVVLGFRREDVRHECAGFGMLIPKIEGFKILGTIFSSSLFSNRAPAGHVLLTSYVGGERQPELATLGTDELVAMVCDDLRVLLGAEGQPVFRHTTLYPKAIPQYNLGYGRYRELMSAVENQAAGLFLAGHYREGVSLGDSIVSGCNVVERVEKFLTTK
ncbi:MAG TPA: protoporphyrinogen oxidase [Candidatus Saccharimonadales bacterium]|nr:protoporphyrinogen oxidase [Candidatus Saccharimonadales bacterium]